MNILPMVFTFLIIFSYLTFSFIREAKSSFLTESTFEGRHRTERALSNAAVERAYRKATKKPGSKKKGTKSTSKRQFASRRTLFPHLDTAKFNLGAFSAQETPGTWKLHPLYEPLAALLRVLYQRPLLSKEKGVDHLEYKLADAILKNLQKKPDATDLAELYPEDPLLQKLYYKMLQGTNQYSQSDGIPPLAHFFCIDKKKKAISLPFAAPEVLEAAFTPKMASLILAAEEKKREETGKYYYISKEDLQNLLIKDPATASLLAELDPYLDHKKNFATRQQLGGRDKRTKIGAVRPLRASS